VSKIIIDYTDTYITGLNTGIQRVVRNILKNRHIIEQITGFETVPVIFAGDLIEKEDIYKKPKIISRVRKFLAKYKSIYPIAARMYKRFAKYRPELLSYKLYARKVYPSKEDIFFIGDAFWAEEYNEDFLNLLSKTNVVLLIYDITPITNQDTHLDHIIKAFNAKFIDMVKNAKLILTISNSEANIIKNFLQSKNIEKPIRAIRLGTDIKLSDKIKKPDVNMDFDNFYLMVGTIEPRKNHLLVLEAFNKIWKEDKSVPNLVIAGRFGWKYERVSEAIYNSPFKDKKLFFLESPSDSELEYLYQHAKALIMASYREGFGLPLIEAMVREIPIIASDIPVFREIASDYPTYFNPYDVNSLIDAIKSSKNLQRKKPNVKLNTWEDTARDIAIAIKEHFLSN
jgi:alpha-1,2-rhamnosyltransferase